MFQIITFYRFINLVDLAEKRESLKLLMRELEFKGTIILANEGFNSTVCGRAGAIDNFIKSAEDILGSAFDVKTSFHERMPFRRIDVKIKREIVTLKKLVDISIAEGTHVEPGNWNAIISDPDTIVLDARNHYEFLNGSFKGAIDPKTIKFSELPVFVKRNLNPTAHKRIAMYCTGGIRCEKFAPYLKSCGFKEIFQLKGGILNYLEAVPEMKSLWQGECFVFDNRITVDSQLKKGVQADHSLSVINESSK